MEYKNFKYLGLNLLFLFFIILLNSNIIEAKMIYGNEWITPGQKYFKIKILTNGIFRIDFKTLNANGLSKNIPKNVRIYRDGKTIPLFVSNSGDSSIFDESKTGSSSDFSDYIEFYGYQNDGSLDSSFYAIKDHQPIPEKSLYFDTAYYYLTFESSSIENKFQNIPKTISTNIQPEKITIQNISNYYNTEFYQGTPLNTEFNYYSSEFGRGEGFASTALNYVPTSANPSIVSNFTIEYPDTNFASNSGTVEIKVAGESDVINSSLNHQLLVQVVDKSGVYSTLGTIIYGGWKTISKTFQLPNKFLLPSLKIKVSSIHYDSFNIDRQRLFYIKLKYNRKTNFSYFGSTRFTLENPYIDTIRFKVNAIKFIGKNKPNYFLYDISNNKRYEPSFINDSLNFIIHPFSDISNFIIQDTQKLSIISQIDKPQIFSNPDFSSNPNFLMVTAKKLAKSSKDYEDYRKKMGYSTLRAFTEDLYNTFSYGYHHPIAIQRFIAYIYNNASSKPEYLLLLGKGYEYKDFRKSLTYFNRDLVPTIGNPCSDLLFTAGLDVDFNGQDPTFTTKLAVGRLTALNDDSVYAYLNKLISIEAQPMIAWKKNVIHVSGGDPANQAAIASYMPDLKDTIEGRYIGARVYEYRNNIALSVNVTVKSKLQDWINKGASLYTYFGHGSSTVLGVDLGKASELRNTDKYTFLCLNGCSIGNPTTEGSLVEDFLFAKNKGAIGALSHSTLTFISNLDAQLIRLYSNIGNKSYGLSIGKSWQHTLDDLTNSGLTDSNSRQMSYSWVLQGDPAYKLPFLDQVDYSLFEDSCSVPLSTIATDDSLIFNFPIFNLGKVTTDSFQVRLIRTYPLGLKDTIDFMSGPIFNQRNFSVWLKNNQNKKPQGANYIEIYIDPDKKLTESNLVNNYLKYNFFLQGNGVRLIYPYDYAIVSDTSQKLYLQSRNFNDTSSTITVEMDTSKRFSNKNLYLLNKTFQASSLIEWNPFKEARFRKMLSSLITNKDTIVFYWRARLNEKSSGTVSDWEKHSFTFIKGSEPGWAQAHWHQYEEIKGTYIDIDTLRRKFKFQFLRSDLELSTHLTYRKELGIIQPSSGVGSYTAAVCPDASVVAMEFDQDSLMRVAPFTTTFTDFPNQKSFGFYTCRKIIYDSLYKNSHPDVSSDATRKISLGNKVIYRQFDLSVLSRTEPTLDYLQNPVKASDSFVKFINNVKQGNYVAIISRGSSPKFSKWSSEAIKAFKKLGSIEIGKYVSSAIFDNNTEFILLGRKTGNVNGNQVGTLITEKFKFIPSPSKNARATVEPDDKTEIIKIQTYMTKSYDSGSFRSIKVGPSRKWKWATQIYKSLENPISDSLTKLNIYGIKKDGSEEFLVSTLNTTYSLSNISADSFPYLRLESVVIDRKNRTPAQLRMWEVLYDGLPEGTIYNDKYAKFNSKRMIPGDTLIFRTRFKNVTPFPMDSLHYVYDFYRDGIKIGSRNFVTKGLKQDSFVNLSLDTTANFSGGNYVVSVFANKNFQQPEKSLDNNFLIKPFEIVQDKTNPILDVTFDGRHISDGELVSAKPTILLTEKDDNKKRLLNESSLIKLSLKSPNSYSFDSIPTNSPDVKFYPATSGQNNKAKLEYKPSNLQDGEYELKAQAFDIAGNKSGKTDYNIRFKIINKTMISNLYVYPNPFSTKARFVFTLTGSRIPDYLKIQIMTITGRVVKEILKEELGNLRVGQNITSYSWDGKDQFGDLLANGLYLYRVITKENNGNEVEKYETAGDKYFEKSIGKLYILR